MATNAIFDMLRQRECPAKGQRKGGAKGSVSILKESIQLGCVSHGCTCTRMTRRCKLYISAVCFVSRVCIPHAQGWIFFGNSYCCSLDLFCSAASRACFLCGLCLSCSPNQLHWNRNVWKRGSRSSRWWRRRKRRGAWQQWRKWPGRGGGSSRKWPTGRTRCPKCPSWWCSSVGWCGASAADDSDRKGNDLQFMQVASGWTGVWWWTFITTRVGSILGCSSGQLMRTPGSSSLLTDWPTDDCGERENSSWRNDGSKRLPRDILHDSKSKWDIVCDISRDRARTLRRWDREKCGSCREKQSWGKTKWAVHRHCVGQSHWREIWEHLQTKGMQETGARRTAMGRRQQMERRTQRENKGVWNSRPRGWPEHLRKLARTRPSRTCLSSKQYQSVTRPKQSTKRDWSNSSVLRTRKNWRSSWTTSSTRQSCSPWTWASVRDDLWAMERSYWRGFCSSYLRTECWGDKISLGRGELWRAGERGPRHDQDDHYQEWCGPGSAGRWWETRNLWWPSTSWWWSWRIADLESDQCMVASDWSLLFHQACQAKHRVTTTRSTWKIKSILGSPKWLPAVPPRGSSSIDTKTSPRNFGEQHVRWDWKTLFRTSAANLERHWTKRDNTAPCWR